MPAEIPDDLREPIRNLERQAIELVAKGNYEMAKNIYKTIYETLYNRQFVENRRIHLGAPLHMMGLSLLFQNNVKEAFRHFLLAYITDTLNVKLGTEEEADEAPACRALRMLFGVSSSVLKSIKDMARLTTDRNAPFDVEQFLQRFLRKQDVKKEEILRLSTREPSQDEIKNIRGQLFQNFLLTENASKLLDKIINTYGSRVLSRAAEIAAKEGHPREITESNIRKAIAELSSSKGGSIV